MHQANCPVLRQSGDAKCVALLFLFFKLAHFAVYELRRALAVIGAGRRLQLPFVAWLYQAIDLLMQGIGTRFPGNRVVVHGVLSNNQKSLIEFSLFNSLF